MKDYYLEQIGIDINECHWNTMHDDQRQPYWKEEEEKYGFDSRQTWSLDYTFVIWFYPRLKMYLDKSNHMIDLKFHKIKFKDNEYNQKQVIEKMLDGFEKYLKDDNNKEYQEAINDAFTLSGMAMRYLWW